MQRPEVLEMWMDQGFILGPRYKCALSSSRCLSPSVLLGYSYFFLAVVHKTVNSRNLSIMTAGFFLSSHLSAWCVRDWDYFPWDVLATYIHTEAHSSSFSPLWVLHSASGALCHHDGISSVLKHNFLSLSQFCQQYIPYEVFLHVSLRGIKVSWHIRQGCS